MSKSPASNDIDQKRIQANLGNARQQETKTFVSQKGVKEILTKDTGIQPSTTIYFGSCTDCEYVINDQCTKILVESCNNFTIILNGGVTTNILEMWKCNDCVINANTKISTIQLDLVKKVKVEFNKQSDYHSIVWAGAYDLDLSFKDAPDHKIITGFTQMNDSGIYPDLKETLDQFIIRFIDGKLLSEQIVRLQNGYPTTEREAKFFDEEQKRKEEAMMKKAEELLKMVNKKHLMDPKFTNVGRNEPCPCKSGKKFKKCCESKKYDAPKPKDPTPSTEKPITTDQSVKQTPAEPKPETK